MSYSVALEGIPGSGKTTLKNQLELSPLSIDRVEQILPNDPDDDTKLTLEDIVKSDMLKTQRLLKRDNDIVILDRYYLSTLAYQYAHDKRYKTDLFPQALNIYEQAITEGLIQIPDVTLYIDTPLQESFTRKERARNTDTWTDEAFLRYIKEFYTQHSPLLVWIDGSLPYNEVKKKIEKIIKGRIANKYGQGRS